MKFIPLTPETFVEQTRQISEEEIYNALAGKVEGLSREVLAKFILELRLEFRDALFDANDKLNEDYKVMDAEFSEIISKKIQESGAVSLDQISAVLNEDVSLVVEFANRKRERLNEYTQQTTQIIREVLAKYKL